MKTYDPLLHLFPEDLELLELQLPRVVHLVLCQGQKRSKSILLSSLLKPTPLITSLRFVPVHVCLCGLRSESLSDVGGYIHQVDDAVAGAQTQAIEFDLFS